MVDEVRAASSAGADMIELRVDYLVDLSLDAMRVLLSAAQSFKGEVIVTCRSADEGGRYDGDEERRAGMLALAASCGADYVDVEYASWRASGVMRQRVGSACRRKRGGTKCRLILSKHDFQKTPSDLERTLDEMAAEPCDVVKIACQAETIIDSLRVLDALRCSASKRPTIALAMGEAGVMTRILARKCGALLTFASLEAGRESAPGQVTLAEMRDLYRFGSTGPDCAVYGVIGCPVAHSMSPAILNAAFRDAGVHAVYVPMRVEPQYEAFEAFIDGCLDRPWLGLGGCSVTIPHKQNLLRYVESRKGEIDSLTARIGAANTLHVESSGDVGFRLSACNTDYLGAMGALCDGMDCDVAALKGRSAAVLGAGGASRAIVAGLCDAGCDVRIYNRTHAKAEVLATEFGARALSVDDRAGHGTDIVINGTSIGMWPKVDDTPMPAEGLDHRPVVFDTIYNPIETRLLREARERGCRTVDGVAMFVRQAAAQFERWIGRPAPVQLMRDVVIARLSK